MALLQLKNVSVKYAQDVLKNINLEVEQGAFLTIFGPSGSGKSTLLKQLKPTFSTGNRSGEIYLNDCPFEQLTERQQVETIGFIHQNPQDQLVVEDVWHELAFGLENIGLTTDEMKLRIGEMAHFFGIQHWFHEKVSSLSGGQKQLLNMAATLVLHPEVLLLDEPTAQLDPIAAKELIELLGRINRDLGVTIILVEHRLEDVLPYTTDFAFMQHGELVLTAKKASFFQQLMTAAPAWQGYLPAVIQASLFLASQEEPAWTIREGIRRLKECQFHTVQQPTVQQPTDVLFEVKNISFRYTRQGKDILRDVSFTICDQEILSIIGSNGAGKSTLLQVMTGQLRAYKGKMYYRQERLKFSKKMYQQEIGFLPQDPLLLFLEGTVQKDYEVFCKRHGLSKQETAERIAEVTASLQLAPLLSKHPEDLSGGERQKVAIGKLLLYRPTLLLLDEPTKGLDPQSKAQLAQLLKRLQQEGMTILVVTHDLEFAATVSNRCGLFFDGEVLVATTPQQFFSNNHFYTTTAHQLAKSFEPSIILTTELIMSINQGENIHEYSSAISRN
ncbi:ABC transporter ATP-binding protein [Kurthia gibsonii]|uniref:ABC transporter ATP-binding protein n=1 Tax=Kurthia gibsonii TaxID=33946 RepID=UPI002DBD18C6|nr:energy-coupling factor transporter ATPase [Kurthia gibsonii]MEB7772285.1 energy-coupling factor transporter ATPase [Kurthia gibsonii]